MIDMAKNRTFQVVFAIAFIGIVAYTFAGSTTVETTASSNVTTTNVDVTSEKTTEASFENQKDETQTIENKNSDDNVDITNDEEIKSTDNIEN